MNWIENCILFLTWKFPSIANNYHTFSNLSVDDLLCDIVSTLRGLLDYLENDLKVWRQKFLLFFVHNSQVLAAGSSLLFYQKACALLFANLEEYAFEKNMCFRHCFPLLLLHHPILRTLFFCCLFHVEIVLQSHERHLDEWGRKFCLSLRAN